LAHHLLLLEVNPQKELEMIASVQIILGFVVGGLGFLQIANNPLTGSSALLLSGFMIMAGIDSLFALKKSGEENR
jgi:hypothetical protein